MDFLLYSKNTSKINDEPLPKIFNGYKLLVFNPNIFKLTIHKEFYLRSIANYVLYKGQYKIIYLFDDNEMVHYSYVTGKCIRFPFMTKNEIQIGPCYTNHKYRGQGIYKSVLNLLSNWNEISGNLIWIYSRYDNLISKKAIESNNFVFHSKISSHTLINILK